MSWCEDNRVDYVFGLRAIPRGLACEMIAEALVVQAAGQWEQTQKPARVFVEFSYQTHDRFLEPSSRRVVAKAEHIPDGKRIPGMW